MTQLDIILLGMDFIFVMYGVFVFILHKEGRLQ